MQVIGKGDNDPPRPGTRQPIQETAVILPDELNVGIFTPQSRKRGFARIDDSRPLALYEHQHNAAYQDGRGEYRQCPSPAIRKCEVHEVNGIRQITDESVYAIVFG